MKHRFLCLALTLSCVLVACTRPNTSSPEPASEANAQIADAQPQVAAPDNAAVPNSGENTMAEEKNVQPTTDELGFQVDSFKTASGKDVAFHCIKHGSIRIQYDGLEFQIDPVSKLGDNETDYTKQPNANYILVTHEHQDHFDTNAIQALESSETKIITNARCAESLNRGDIMKNGDAKQLRDDIKLEAVPAYNTTDGRDKFHPKGRDNGFILTLDGFRIYIAGDTEDIPEMDQIKDIDVAFLPCNQPFTMTTDQLSRATETIRPKVLFPYHFGNTPTDDIVKAVTTEGVDLRIRNYQ